MANKKKLSLIIPVYNETKILRYFVTHLISVIKKTRQIKNSKYQFEIIIINDGSEDETIDILNKLPDENKKIKYINLSKNFGKEAALTAGIDFCNGDIAIPIDVDFQDDPSIIGKLIEKWNKGLDVVLLRRKNSKTNFFLESIKIFFYKIINLLSEIKLLEKTTRLFSIISLYLIFLFRILNRMIKN
jgi:glycosyltransferase involved in cell wall biosynthesis